MLGTMPKMVAFMKSFQQTPDAAAAELMAVKGMMMSICKMSTRGYPLFWMAVFTGVFLRRDPRRLLPQWP
jgi:hypothetical protein